MTGGGACDLGRLTRPSTIASARTALGERMQIALTKTSARKRIRQFSNRYSGRKVRVIRYVKKHSSPTTFISFNEHRMLRGRKSRLTPVRVGAFFPPKRNGAIVRLS